MIQSYLRSIPAAVITLLLVVQSCSKSKGVDDDDTDRTPPEAVSDLCVLSYTSQSAVLRWTTPADHRDDNSGGMVDGYDLRLSYDSITPQNFTAAALITSVPGPLPAGQMQQWPIGDLTADSTYFFALKSVDDRGNWSSASNCVSVHCPAIVAVHIADSVLERMVREQIQKPTGDLLTSDVDTIWQLVVQNSGITTLEGLQHFSSLIVANFASNEISDLSPLSGLPHLAGVYLSDNAVADVSPLTGMVTMRQIHLADNPITEIGPLATLDSLQQVVLTGTQVTDFSPLYDLPLLTDVNFSGMHLADIGFMSHLVRLRICVLSFNSITSTQPLRNLSMIESLNLMQNLVGDLEPLTPLVNLRELRLTNNQITDLAALVNNSGIDSGDVLYLVGNPLSQTALNSQVPTLEGRGVIVNR
jgi:hypothetical protein